MTNICQSKPRYNYEKQSMLIMNVQISLVGNVYQKLFLKRSPRWHLSSKWSYRGPGYGCQLWCLWHRWKIYFHHTYHELRTEERGIVQYSKLIGSDMLQPWQLAWMGFLNLSFSHFPLYRKHAHYLSKISIFHWLILNIQRQSAYPKSGQVHLSFLLCWFLCFMWSLTWH